MVQFVIVRKGGMGKYMIKNLYQWTKNQTLDSATLVRSSNTELLHVPKWIYTQCTNHITSSDVCKSLDI